MLNIWHVMDKCAPVAKKEVFYVWPFGLGAWLAGVVFIDRLNSNKAHDQLNHAANLMKTDKVCLFLASQHASGLSANREYLHINR
jgi:lysophosphatidate acyltransferase